jgi:hypothetical protein
MHWDWWAFFLGGVIAGKVVDLVLGWYIDE